MQTIPEPHIQDGISYWESQPASYDGVLGGFGLGTLPRVDALGSRQFLLDLVPAFSTVTSPINPHPSLPPSKRYRALDVGAGVGRVTSDVLLHLVHDVVLVEPAQNLILEALARGRSESRTPQWKGIRDRTKSVCFFRGPLQSFDPSHPLQSPSTNFLGRIGEKSFCPPSDVAQGALPADLVAELESGFDVVWCQWMLGHLSNPDLLQFLARARASLREPGKSLIVIKENCCSDGDDGVARTVFDKEDSSLTRSDLAWKKLFADANLTLVHEQVQRGLPAGLYMVCVAVMVHSIFVSSGWVMGT